MTVKKEHVDLDRERTLTRIALTAKPRKEGGAVGVSTAWTLTAAAGNVDSAYLHPVGRTRIESAEVAGAPGGWANAALLSKVGADEHTLQVKVAAPAGEVVKEVVLVAQRKIPMTVYYTDAETLRLWKAAFKVFEAEYKKVGIAFDVKGVVKTDVAEVDFEKGVDRREFLAGDLSKLFTSGALPPVEPAAGHLRAFAIKEYRMLLDFPWGGAVTGADFAAMQTSGEFDDLLPAGPARFTASPVLSAKLKFRQGTPRVIDIASAIRRHGANGKGIKVTPTAAMVSSAGGRDGSLEVVLEAVETGFLGWSDGMNLLVVGTHDRTGHAHPAERVAKVAIHEVGHALGQVRAERYKYAGAGASASSETNASHYEDHGGVGHHCQTNAEEGTGTRAPNVGKPIMEWTRGAGAAWKTRLHLGSAWNDGDLCVMYHDAGAAHASTRFCPNCQLDLRIADLTTTSGGVRAAWKA